VVRGAPNPNFAFKLGGTGSNFGGTFDGGWKTFQGPSIPENTEKIHTGVGEKLGVQFWGLKLLITHGSKCIGKVLEAFKENGLYTSSQLKPMGY